MRDLYQLPALALAEERTSRRSLSRRYQPHRAALRTSTTTHKFTGYERDSETNLDNAQARYNSSSLGRFMSPDPLGNFVADATNPQTWNMYAYVNNNPLAFIDPTGLEGEGGGPPLRTLPSWFDCQPLMFTRTHGNPFDAGTPYGPTDFFDTQSTFCGAGGDFARHIVDGGGVGGARPQAPTFKQQYNQCVQGAGTTLKVADTLGVWGLGSLAVTAGSSAFTSTMQWIHGTSATNIASTVAQQAPNTAADAGTLANMGEHELFLEGTWATVGKISLWVTAGATAVSGGVRGYCAAKAAF